MIARCTVKIVRARSCPILVFDLLKTGPMPVNQIESEARNAGVPLRTLQGAADYLTVIRKRFPDHWTWELPI